MSIEPYREDMLDSPRTLPMVTAQELLKSKLINIIYRSTSTTPGNLPAGGSCTLEKEEETRAHKAHDCYQHVNQ
jgi:hypothetical protein